MLISELITVIFLPFAFRLCGVRGRLLTALADDFNTHKAMEALMDLAQVGNRQLQNTIKVTHSCRCCCNETPSMRGQDLDYFYLHLIQKFSKLVFKKVLNAI